MLFAIGKSHENFGRSAESTRSIWRSAAYADRNPQKADGRALGKGVLICNTLEEAREGVQSIMMDNKFGNRRQQDGH